MRNCDSISVIESRSDLNHWSNSILEFRESRHGEAKKTMQHECRNRDSIAVVESRSYLDRWSQPVSEFHESRYQKEKKCNETSKIAICDIVIKSQSLSQDQTWIVDHTPYRSFEKRDMERQKKQCNMNYEIAICNIVMWNLDLIWTVRSRYNLDRWSDFFTGFCESGFVSEKNIEHKECRNPI